MAYSSYYDPSSLYGAAPGETWDNTPALGPSSNYMNDNPEAAFLRFVSPWAGGNDQFSRFVRSQYGDALTGFKAAFATNPKLDFTKYLNQLGQGFFQQRYMSLAPQQRGWDNSSYGGGRMQWFSG